MSRFQRVVISVVAALALSSGIVLAGDSGGRAAFLSLFDAASAPVSGAHEATIRFNDGTGKLEQSAAGGSWVTLGTGAGGGSAPLLLFLPGNTSPVAVLSNGGDYTADYSNGTGLEAISTTNTEIMSTGYGAFPVIGCRYGSASPASKGAATAGACLGRFDFASFDDAGARHGGEACIYGFASENWTVTGQGAYLVFCSCPTGTSGGRHQWTVTPDTFSNFQANGPGTLSTTANGDMTIDTGSGGLQLTGPVKKVAGETTAGLGVAAVVAFAHTNPATTGTLVTYTPGSTNETLRVSCGAVIAGGGATSATVTASWTDDLGNAASATVATGTASSGDVPYTGVLMIGHPHSAVTVAISGTGSSSADVTVERLN